LLIPMLLICAFYIFARDPSNGEGYRAERRLLFLRHLASDFFHEFGAETGEDAVDDAGDIIRILGWGGGRRFW